MTDFHAWLGTDADDSEDQCLGCGVITPDQGEGVVSDHSPLPIFCPGPEVVWPHHFVALGDDKIGCWCGVVVTPDTMPNEIRWECLAQGS